MPARFDAQDELVFLGFAESVTTTEGSAFQGRRWMFANHKLTQLIMLSDSLVQPLGRRRNPRSVKESFEEWSGYPASKQRFQLTLPTGTQHARGTAVKIKYRSDKIIEPGDRGRGDLSPHSWG